MPVFIGFCRVHMLAAGCSGNQPDQTKMLPSPGEITFLSDSFKKRAENMEIKSIQRVFIAAGATERRGLAERDHLSRNFRPNSPRGAPGARGGENEGLSLLFFTPVIARVPRGWSVFYRPGIGSLVPDKIVALVTPIHIYVGKVTSKSPPLPRATSRRHNYAECESVRLARSHRASSQARRRSIPLTVRSGRAV